MADSWLRLVLVVLLVVFPTTSVLSFGHLRHHVAPEDNFLPATGTAYECQGPYSPSPIALTGQFQAENPPSSIEQWLSSSSQSAPTHHDDETPGPNSPCSCPCSVCSLAKGSCPGVIYPHLEIGPGLEGKIWDTDSLYTSPFCGKPIHPPRA